MSKLTDYQLRRVLEGCESTARMHAIDGKVKLRDAALARAAEYREELAARERGEAVQEPQGDTRR